MAVFNIQVTEHLGAATPALNNVNRTFLRAERFAMQHLQFFLHQSASSDALYPGVADVSTTGPAGVAAAGLGPSRATTAASGPGSACVVPVGAGGCVVHSH